MSLKFNMQLARDLVAVLPGIKKKSKVVVPDWQRSLQGEVLAVGTDVLDINVGDKVVFGAAKGMECVYDGAAIRIMKAEDVDMILEGENAVAI
jgi:co-chaperonin GroES (HSP10)